MGRGIINKWLCDFVDLNDGEQREKIYDKLRGIWWLIFIGIGIVILSLDSISSYLEKIIELLEKVK